MKKEKKVSDQDIWAVCTSLKGRMRGEHFRQSGTGQCPENCEVSWEARASDMRVGKGGRQGSPLGVPQDVGSLSEVWSRGRPMGNGWEGDKQGQAREARGEGG